MNNNNNNIIISCTLPAQHRRIVQHPHGSFAPATGYFLGLVTDSLSFKSRNATRAQCVPFFGGASEQKCFWWDCIRTCQKLNDLPLLGRCRCRAPFWLHVMSCLGRESQAQLAEWALAARRGLATKGTVSKRENPEELEPSDYEVYLINGLMCSRLLLQGIDSCRFIHCHLIPSDSYP